MAYKISQRDPESMSTEEILSEIDGFKFLAVEVVERLALMLKTLRQRRQPHPFFADRILKFWESICDQSLSAEAAILLGNQELIRAVLPLRLDEQLAFSKGAEVPVAEVADDGSVHRAHLPIQRMSPSMLKRAFGPDGLRSVSEQSEIIRSQGRIERHGIITVLRDENAVKIGNSKLRWPEDFEVAARALGYRLVLERQKERA